MRKLVLQMMTTINGRVDSPFAWMTEVTDDCYGAIGRYYAEFDTIIVGRTTYGEMVDYWPAALANREGTETNLVMARYMHDYRKIVFSRGGDRALPPWHNAQTALAPDGATLTERIQALKSQPGKDIHLAGGATFAQTVVGLGLVDEFRLFVFPSVSEGAVWHAGVAGEMKLELIGSRVFGNGVMEARYRPAIFSRLEAPDRFTDLLA